MWSCPCLCGTDGTAGLSRTDRAGKNHPGVQCGYVLHTVPVLINDGRVTKADKELLASLNYRSCWSWQKNGLESVAFCCISTGNFIFPPEEAARIAIETVKFFKNTVKSR